MARRVMVQYKVKADRLEEHERLVRDVFSELAGKAPPGIRYGAFKRADGLSFVHIAMITADTNPLDAIAAFKRFGASIKDRCDVAPEVVELGEVGAYEL